MGLDPTGFLLVQPDQALLSTLLRSPHLSMARRKHLGVLQGQAEAGSLATSVFQPCPPALKYNLLSVFAHVMIDFMPQLD